ncbi:hypothetical protein C0V76_14395 [Uliginosibacterium sp. TH139]|nr:hypothetical protein C0V76_14395 [Uliginosibacterium sp. TH139]
MPLSNTSASDPIRLDWAACKLRLQADSTEPGAGDAEDDLFSFMEEDAQERPPTQTEAPWVLLIVDDEQQVHEATTLTLRRGRIGDRPFRFLHAHSAAEAREVILAEPHIDLVLLDVMMETRDAGLRLVRELRGPLGRQDLKILIRSGQPGAEHEGSIEQRYAVEGYMQKTQQTFGLMMDVISKILLGADEHLDTAN